MRIALAPSGVRALAVTSSFLFILGAKLWAIAWFGSSTPFWDEWDGAAAFLFKPYLEGHLRLADLVAAHNEHRILLTRLLSLGLLDLAGYWDVVLQMIVNAVIHSAAMVAIAAVLSNVLDSGKALTALAFTSVLTAIPFGWENTLLAFNTHFYLIIALSFGSLLALSSAVAWSGRWWLGTSLGVLSFFCLASGVLVFPAVICLHLVQMALRRRSGLGEWIALVAQVVLTIALVMSIPTVAQHEALHADSAREFIPGLIAILSWPSASSLGLVLYAPAALFGLRLLMEPPELSDARWLHPAVFGWLLGQFAAFAYGRASDVLAPRNLDIIQLGLILNVVSALFIFASFKTVESAWQRWAFMMAAAAWLLALVFWLGTAANSKVAGGLEFRGDSAAMQAENVRGYLASGDYSYLADKPDFEIPYPSAERLSGLLDDPTIRSILPSSLIRPEQPRAREGAVRAVKRALLGSWNLVLLSGAGVFILALLSQLLIRHRAAPARKTTGTPDGPVAASLGS